MKAPIFKPTVADMQAHVLSIIEERDILVSWQKTTRGSWAALEVWEISIAPITTEISYAVALHEIGHLLGKHQLSRTMLTRERYAWSWAERNAIAWTSAMDWEKRNCLEFYERTPWKKINPAEYIDADATVACT